MSPRSCVRNMQENQLHIINSTFKNNPRLIALGFGILLAIKMAEAQPILITFDELQRTTPIFFSLSVPSILRNVTRALIRPSHEVSSHFMSLQCARTAQPEAVLNHSSDRKPRSQLEWKSGKIHQVHPKEIVSSYLWNSKIQKPIFQLFLFLAFSCATIKLCFQPLAS